MRRLDVAVVGAGPAGLATALFLHRAGHRPVVLERFVTARPVGSGLLLQPTGLSVLAELGLADRLFRRGNRVDRLEGRAAGDGRIVLDMRYGAVPGRRFGLAMHRSALFDVLMEAVRDAGIDLLTAREIVDLDRGDGVAPLDAAGRRHGRFDHAVDASGGASRLRRLAAVPAEPRPLAYGALWTTVDFPDAGFDPHALTQVYRAASIMIGVLPVGRPSGEGGPKAAFFWSLKPQTLQALHAAGLDRWKAEALSHWPELGTILGGIDDFAQLTLARYGHHTLRVPAGPGIAFVGDSAHSTSPQLGQGANMALLDAAALAHALVTEVDPAVALDAYARARRRHVRLFQLLSLWLTPLYQSDSLAASRLRDVLVGGFGRMPVARRLMAHMVAGTLIDPFAATGFVEADWSRSRPR